MYDENRVNNEINNIDVDKEKDANRYVHKQMNIVNDKISLLNNVLESIDDLMGGIDGNTSNDIALKRLKDFKSHIAKLINRFNLYIKQDTKKKGTKNNTQKKDTKNNTKPNTKINKRKKLKITPNQIPKITPNQILKIILKIKILKITPNQILKITPNQILKMTSNRILIIPGRL